MSNPVRLPALKAAREALARLEDPPAVKTAREALARLEDPPAVKTVREALARLEDPPAVKTVREALARLEDPPAVKTAREALARLEDPPAVKTVREALARLEDPPAVKTAREALARLEDPPAVKTVREALARLEDPPAVKTAREALARLEDPPAVKTVREALARLEDPPAVKTAREALARLEDPPAVKTAREALARLEDPPAVKTVREALARLEDPPAVKTAREALARLEDPPAVKTVREALARLEDPPAVKTVREALARLEDPPAVKTAREALVRLEDPPAVKTVREALARLALEINRVIVPTPTVLQVLSRSVARTVPPLQDRFASIEEWHLSIGKRMAGIGAPWAIAEHLDVAGAGFARIARLHDLSTGTTPFDPQVVEIFDEELGQPVPFDVVVKSKDRDMTAIDAGLNPEVVAFPRRAYPEVLFSAGFEIRIETAPSVVSDGGDSSGVLNAQYKTLFREIENRLRMVVEAELKALVGHRWYRQRVPSEMLKRWKKRKNEDHQRRGDSYPIVYYADFMDLPQVICQRDNWRDVFERYFLSKDDLQVSLRRLNPVRNALAHNRPLVRSDQLILFSEGSRILTALGCSRIHGDKNGR